MSKDINKILKQISETEQRLYSTGAVLKLCYDDKRYIVALFAYPIAGLNGIRVAEEQGTLKALRQIEERLSELEEVEKVA